jgi:hypothetical protein
MIAIEGEFSGEVVIPLIPNTKCNRKSLGNGENYQIIQKLRLDDGTWQILPANDVRILTGESFVTCVNLGYYRFEIYGAKEPGVLVDYKDRVTEEVFEVHFSSFSAVTPTVINPKTGNVADKQFPSGHFKFTNNDFH